MRILWFAWKDREHPQAGGAELVREELAERLAKDGHDVRFLVGGFKGGASEIQKNGFTITRLGGRFSVYWRAHQYYIRHLRGWADFVVDEVNTIPFFASWYCREPVILFIHQLARQIWFYEIFFPLSLFGYLIEPVYLWHLRRLPVITISESTKKDLQRFGFSKNHIHIISEGIAMEPIADFNSIIKDKKPTLLALGSIRPMKRTHHVIRAFEIAKQDIPDLQLMIAGAAEGWYGKCVLKMIRRSPFSQEIQYLGRVEQSQKIALLRRAHLLCVASVKEGWGLTVTEANSQGTPAVAYDVDGLRDSIRNGETGIVCAENTPEMMAKSVAVLLKDAQNYQRLRENAWEWSQTMTFDSSARNFLPAVYER